MQEVLQFAESLVGKIPYNLNKIDPEESGMNCLGFIHYVRKHGGLYTPTDWNEAPTMGVEVPRKAMRPGDIIVLPNTPGWIKKYELPVHFMLVAEKGFLHIGTKKGLTLSDNPFHDDYVIRRIYDL